MLFAIVLWLRIIQVFIKMWNAKAGLEPSSTSNKETAWKKWEALNFLISQKIEWNYIEQCSFHCLCSPCSGIGHHLYPYNTFILYHCGLQEGGWRRLDSIYNVSNVETTFLAVLCFQTLKVFFIVLWLFTCQMF